MWCGYGGRMKYGERKPDAMRRKIVVFIAEEDHERLRTQGIKRRISVSEIVRQAVLEKLPKLEAE